MTIASTRLDAYADALYAALRNGHVLEPLSDREPGLSIAEAYHISRRILACREAAGERLVGKKIGVTSEPVQKMLDVDQPDFGFLMDTMQIEHGGTLAISKQSIQPKAEGEIAFQLRRDLRGPGITAADVLAATETVMVAIEIVDSRIRDWKIRIQDTIADNASCGYFVLGSKRVDPRHLELERCELVMALNGVEISRGFGEAALGSPYQSVAWLANALGEYGVPLTAGEIILSGSLVPLRAVAPGDRVSCHIAELGEVAVQFA